MPIIQIYTPTADWIKFHTLTPNQRKSVKNSLRKAFKSLLSKQNHGD